MVSELLKHLGVIYETLIHEMFSIRHHKLKQLQQGNRSFSDFYEDFMQFIEADTAMNDWNLMWELREKLSGRL